MKNGPSAPPSPRRGWCAQPSARTTSSRAAVPRRPFHTAAPALSEAMPWTTTPTRASCSQSSRTWTGEIKKVSKRKKESKQKEMNREMPHLELDVGLRRGGGTRQITLDRAFEVVPARAPDPRRALPHRADRVVRQLNRRELLAADCELAQLETDVALSKTTPSARGAADPELKRVVFERQRPKRGEAAARA